MPIKSALSSTRNSLPYAYCSNAAILHRLSSHRPSLQPTHKNKNKKIIATYPSILPLSFLNLTQILPAYTTHCLSYTAQMLAPTCAKPFRLVPSPLILFVFPTLCLILQTSIPLISTQLLFIPLSSTQHYPSTCKQQTICTTYIFDLLFLSFISLYLLQGLFSYGQHSIPFFIFLFYDFVFHFGIVYMLVKNQHRIFLLLFRIRFWIGSFRFIFIFIYILCFYITSFHFVLLMILKIQKN